MRADAVRQTHMQACVHHLCYAVVAHTYLDTDGNGVDNFWNKRSRLFQGHVGGNQHVEEVVSSILVHDEERLAEAIAGCCMYTSFVIR